MASKRRRVVTSLPPVRTISTRRVKSSQDSKQDKVQANNQIISEKAKKVRSSSKIEKTKPITDKKPKEIVNNNNNSDEDVASDNDIKLQFTEDEKPHRSRKVHKCQICLKIFKGKIFLQIFRILQLNIFLKNISILRIERFEKTSENSQR